MEESVKLRKQLVRTRAVVAILSIVSILMFVFAYIQKLEANKQHELVIEQMRFAEQAKAEAEQQHMIAAVARAEAEKQKMVSEEHTISSGENYEMVNQLKKDLEAQQRIAEQNQMLAKRNEERALQAEIKAKQNAILAKQSEQAAKKALDDCLKKTN